ncbi:hypothetical protein CCM_04869 [Cordyceps militaris CM01]|uniref:Uncharacterized protein n=1 Tax=Cordyceps militaris (strain CM01) TaxID=983644 RepID=G3JF02_CORMM|nr:uncharacterized protein CCM_04869 [Cordyceps militaris CM01]EGX93495.1 hypothetical protein CCM_04869 [Cordyceps militaris CM01]
MAVAAGNKRAPAVPLEFSGLGFAAQGSVIQRLLLRWSQARLEIPHGRPMSIVSEAKYTLLLHFLPGYASSPVGPLISVVFACQLATRPKQLGSWRTNRDPGTPRHKAMRGSTHITLLAPPTTLVGCNGQGEGLGLVRRHPVPTRSLPGTLGSAKVTLRDQTNQLTVSSAK